MLFAFALATLVGPPPSSDYAEALSSQLRSGCTLVVFVGADPVETPPGVLACSVKELSGVKAGSVVVATVDRGQSWKRAVYEYAPSTDELKTTVDAVAGTPVRYGPTYYRRPLVDAALAPFRMLVGGCPGGVCPSPGMTARRRGR